MSRSISPLLAAGIVAGPLFVGASLVEAFTRDGFDITWHPISLLSLGELGWIQITNFVVSGLLYVASAAGMRRALSAGRGSVWAPRLVALTGAGLVVAGVCTADAGAGFPPGAPEGAPDYSWHGILHEAGFAVTMVSWLAACLVFRSRYSAVGERAWSRACVAAPAAVVLVNVWPDLDSISVRLVIGAGIQFAFFAALILHVGAAAPDRAYAGSDVHISSR
ncbi:DUF998 domain-containing protein [Kribbella pittospori]|uniref:DUF998 domain-containing protein n=1 Tax=Kribbella pittospori TaxID=722689 RepID=A0A4R0K345_9ACTN|nr:DUF998 domain-containing protein [Kribbella pittospori]TCC52158.1 DUF998 domain-containing protein [Kribbella pittospori]